MISGYEMNCNSLISLTTMEQPIMTSEKIRQISSLVNLAGNRYERLLVKRYCGKSQWLCQCDCGLEVTIRSSSLKSGMTKSCGCYRKEINHGKLNTLEYRSWAMMLTRCTSQNNHAYPDYGGRGISVAPQWYDFKVFFSDMGVRPSKKHSLDRFPDNDGNYEPGNCRWATQKQQCRNTRQTVMVEVDGETIPLIDYCEKLNLPHSLIRARIWKGMPLEKAILPPHSRNNACGDIQTALV
jgi:hypothetical protein